MAQQDTKVYDLRKQWDQKSDFSQPCKIFETTSNSFNDYTNKVMTGYLQQAIVKLSSEYVC